jgi:hypothetical protein
MGITFDAETRLLAQADTKLKTARTAEFSKKMSFVYVNVEH